jgi:tyrosine-protein kinase Etk/Wzc
MVSENSNISEKNESSPIQGKSQSFFSKEVDIEKIFFIVINKWPLILLSTVLSFFIANLYLRYATPQYSAFTRLLIKDTRSSSGMSEAVVFQDLGILNSGRNLDNEIQVLRTKFLMEEVVRRLNLQYKYESQGRLKSREFYKETPITVLSWEPNDSSFSRTFQLQVKLKANDQFTMEADGKSYNGQFGQAIKLPFGRITLGIPNYAKAIRQADARDILITVRSVSSAANVYSKSLNVSLDQKSRSTVLELSCTDVIPRRAIDVLTETIKVYNETEIADKNRIFENTVKFIDERMDILGGELRAVEGDVASFRAQTGAINLAGEGAMLLSETSSSTNELVALDAQLQIATAIKSQLQMDGAKFNFVPTSEGLTTPAIFNLLSTFNTLLLERERLIIRLGAKHPDIELIEKQLTNLRENIIDNINNSERDLNIRRNALAKQGREIDRRIRVLPSTEKQLLEIQRQQVIKQELYLYLLQKREEAALSLSVTVANNREIEPARFGGQVSPKSKQIQLFSVSAGLFLPILLLLIWNGLNKHVMTEDQIVSQTNTPIIGTIPNIENKNHIVVSDGKRSAAAEMFRLVRANFQYVGGGVNNKVIAFTSSVSGEGKSFITLNLGLTLALAKKKVVLIELDMRKPKLAQYLGFQKGSGRGITDYLVDESVDRDAIIYPSSYNDNLFYIPCGPLPPNPSELLLGERLEELLKALKSEFDYVLLDTPPIGLVSDALLLNKHLDATFYIVRQGVTQQRQLKIVDEINSNKKMPRVYVIFNGVKFGSGGYGYGTGYGYGYGYNYGYGYGYYADDKKNLPRWKRILGISK